HNVGYHLTNYHRRVLRGEGVALDDDSGPRLAVVAGCRDRNDVTASHRHPVRRPPQSISAHPTRKLDPDERLAWLCVAAPVLSAHGARPVAPRAGRAGVAVLALPSSFPLGSPLLFSMAS